MRNRPLWRWWLFCVCLALWWRLKWDWCARLYSWSVLPEWLGWNPDDPPATGEDAPF